MSTPQYQFDQETELIPLGPNRWQSQVVSDWNIATHPNGGYLMGLIGKAMLQDSEKPDPFNLSVQYLRPGKSDEPCVIETEVVRVGRTISVVRGRLSQNNKVRLEALGSFTNAEVDPGPVGLSVEPDIELPPPEECDGDFDPGIARKILERVELRIHPDQTLAGTSDVARVDGWLRFRDGRPLDTLSLLVLSDVMPPPIYASHGQIGWVPTVELNVHVRRRPKPGWIRAQFKTNDVFGNRLIEDGILWDETGAVVAQSRQVALLLMA